MPIDIDEFEDMEPEELRELALDDTDYDRVLQYLAFNPRRAYARDEIQSSVGITGIDLFAILSRLEAEGYVRHKGRYWAISPEYDGEYGSPYQQDEPGSPEP